MMDSQKPMGISGMQAMRQTIDGTKGATDGVEKRRGRRGLVRNAGVPTAGTGCQRMSSVPECRGGAARAMPIF